MDEKDTIKFIHAVDNWPQWPWLPVKRHQSSGLQTGVIYGGKKTEIRNVNLFALTRESWEAAEVHEYHSVEALVADGWVVD